MSTKIRTLHRQIDRLQTENWERNAASERSFAEMQTTLEEVKIELAETRRQLADPSPEEAAAYLGALETRRSSHENSDQKWSVALDMALRGTMANG